MIQGTGSNVGKSLIVAGLCRYFSNQGMKVAPFKPQNMSNNAAVTTDGGEIGRAQYLQAQACRTDATVDMNPVLLKPESGSGAQIIVRGQATKSVCAREYTFYKQNLMIEVLKSYNNLANSFDMIIAEGAGSPAENNLRKDDIANMGFAQKTKMPVILVSDIDRGGIIAQIVGTKTVLNPVDANMIKGFITNKFRGDPALFYDGYREIEERTGWPGLGVLPWFTSSNALPAEDSLDLGKTSEIGNKRINICFLALGRIANFDDLDPLRLHPEISIKIIQSGEVIPGNANLVIIPGSKSTIKDLEGLRKNGWDIDIKAHVRRGGHVLGICGGYQMLGRQIYDASGVDGTKGTIDGLGLLNIETSMVPTKKVKQTRCKSIDGSVEFDAYEIHVGHARGPDRSNPFTYTLDEIGNWIPEGSKSIDGKICGTYLHGFLASDTFRERYLGQIISGLSEFTYANVIEDTLDKLADHIAKHIKVEQIYSIMKSYS